MQRALLLLALSAALAHATSHQNEVVFNHTGACTVCDEGANCTSSGRLFPQILFVMRCPALTKGLPLKGGNVNCACTSGETSCLSEYALDSSVWY